MIGDPTYADAILDRLVHNAHRIELHGRSMRGPKRAAAGDKTMREYGVDRSYPRYSRNPQPRIINGKEDLMSR